MEKGYKKLIVWKNAHAFAIEVYKQVKDFPKFEEFGVTAQLRRAALSVPTNIVEGQACVSKKEFLNFLNIANRSLVESEYLLEVSLELKYINEEQYKSLDSMRRDVGVLLHSLIQGVKARL